MYIQYINAWVGALYFYLSSHKCTCCYFEALGSKVLLYVQCRPPISPNNKQHVIDQYSNERHTYCASIHGDANRPNGIQARQRSYSLPGRRLVFNAFTMWPTCTYLHTDTTNTTRFLPLLSAGHITPFRLIRLRWISDVLCLLAS